jgi:hypothetical protein
VDLVYFKQLSNLGGWSCKMLGKPKKVAIIACIRKLIVIINSMMRDGVMWDPKMI